MPKLKDEPVINRSFYVKEKKRPAIKISRMLSIVLFIAFFVLILVGLGVFWLVRDDLDQNYFTTIANDIAWNFRQRAQTSSEKIIFDGNIDNAYAAFKDGLAVLTTNRLVCYDASGKEMISAERVFKNPCLQTSSKNVLAYDRGGETLVLLNERALLLDIKTERPIITAKLNKQGYITLVTQTEAYKALVTVMDATGTAVFKYYSPDYILDAVLSSDSAMLAVSCAGIKDSWIKTQIKVFDRFNAEPEPVTVITPEDDEDIILDLFFQKGGKILTVGKKTLSFYDPDGVLLNSMDYSGRVLLDFSVMNDGVAVRTARTYNSVESRLELFDFDGKLVDSTEVNEEIICQSGGGDYVTLVTSHSILVYDHKLELKSNEPNEMVARQILQRDNGTMFLIFNDYALIYSP